VHSGRLSAKFYNSKVLLISAHEDTDDGNYLATLLLYLIHALRLRYHTRSLIRLLYVGPPSLESIVQVVIEYRPKAAGCTVGGSGAIVR
jgi:hypothetical protein